MRNINYFLHKYPLFASHSSVKNDLFKIFFFLIFALIIGLKRWSQNHSKAYDDLSNDKKNEKIFEIIITLNKV